VPKGALVAFHEMEKAEIKLRGETGANVLLRGELTAASGQRQPAQWHVELRYDRAISEWVGVLAREAPVGS
jgi:hypothetical protein